MLHVARTIWFLFVGSLCHSQFIDVLMKTYTSEAVFLLTTFVNMARSRTENDPEEVGFINLISHEIFQVSYVIPCINTITL